MDEINVGDKVFYKTVLGEIIKAVVVSSHVEKTYLRDFQRYTIRVTSRNSRMFYYGYIFEASATWVWRR